jgi:flagellar basal-body rod protein FlgB
MDRLDRFFGVAGETLRLRSGQMQVLASNIANAATPGYRARDIDFGAALAGRMAALRGGVPAGETAAGGPVLTHPRHMAGETGVDGAALRYRLPVQASLDGNTVELATEQLAFAETALRYRSSLSFLDSRIGSLKAALKGE